MEYDNDYRLSKNELEHYPIFKKLGFKRINDDLKRLGYKYQIDKRKNGHKGCWEGLQLKQDYGEEDERDDLKNLIHTKITRHYNLNKITIYKMSLRMI